MNKRLGIIGCGQLGQMLGHAAQRLGLEVNFLSLDETPVVYGAGRLFLEHQLEEFLNHCDVVTVEREALPEETLVRVEQAGKLAYPLNAFKKLSHRDSQKALLDQHAIPTAAWQLVERPEDFGAALSRLPGRQVRCKQVLGGYDGGGQWRIDKKVPQQIPDHGFPLLAECEIDVEAEISILLARDARGTVVYYPIVENHMSDGILKWSFAPAPLDPVKVELMRDYATRLVHAVDYVGVMAIEFFLSDGGLLVNEVAPRVHNTGHWTMNACDCDQFELHVRAIAGLPLSAPKQREAAAMCNLLGGKLPDMIPDSPVRMYVHTYGKMVRLGRKVGHLTLVAPELETLRSVAQQMDL